MKQRIKAHEHDLQTDKHMRKKSAGRVTLRLDRTPQGKKSKKSRAGRNKMEQNTARLRETDGQKAQEEERKKRGALSACEVYLN